MSCKSAPAAYPQFLALCIASFSINDSVQSFVLTCVDGEI
ncbi:unnamed protein product, partial [Staurois parvus]